MKTLIAIWRAFIAFLRARSRKRKPQADVGDFLKFTLPLIRKSFPSLIASDIVSVQPMSQPNSLIFYRKLVNANIKNQHGQSPGLHDLQ